MTDRGTPTIAPDAGSRDARYRRIALAWLLIYLLSALAVAVQRTLFAPENNFVILRTSSLHLVTGQDLYAAYPAIYQDFFKYSPTFAFLWAPFAVLPPVPGYMLWAVACVLALYAGIMRALPPSRAVVALALSWLAVFGDLQRSQSNALCAGLMILAWADLERGSQWRPAIAVAVATFVKLFPAAAVLPALFHGRRLRFAAIFAVVVAAGIALPLLVTHPSMLAMQYRSWFRIESRDAIPLARYGTGGADLYAGLMGQFRVWWGVHWPNWPAQVTGAVILVAPLALRRASWERRQFRVLFLASMLVFCVLFNHQAESPSYSIAIIGASVWYAVSERTWWRTVLIAGCIVIVNVASTDLMPRTWYREWYVPYLVKTIPLIPLWIIMQLELLGVIPNPGVLERAKSNQLDIAAAEALT
ncbi:MAG: glycosyltransferase family 87 protein [Gemmatimonadales bacterium]